MNETTAGINSHQRRWEDLAAEWEALLSTEPKLRIRDAAARLGASEVELLATRCGESVRRLECDLPGLFDGFTRWGRTMALTRNEYAVHERKGPYQNVSFSGPFGLVLGPDIDLRIFPAQWKSAFAVESAGRDGTILRSIQFFNGAGDAVHKVYALDESRLDQYEALVSKYLSRDQSRGERVERSGANAGAQSTGEPSDIPGFQAAWLALQDTHD
ncbi:MAG: hemin-degrading factor, partial [Myxococcales bacterium]|nr:hemin-degrading factor [Myxococcales bacterium]